MESLLLNVYIPEEEKEEQGKLNPAFNPGRYRMSKKISPREERTEQRQAETNESENTTKVDLIS